MKICQDSIFGREEAEEEQMPDDWNEDLVDEEDNEDTFLEYLKTGIQEGQNENQEEDDDDDEEITFYFIYLKKYL